MVINIFNLLDQYIRTGFSLDTLANVTQVPVDTLNQIIEIKGLSGIEKTEKIEYLVIFLTQLFGVSPQDDYYLIEQINSLTRYFDVSVKAIASYLGISEEKLLDILEKEDFKALDLYSREITHLFAVFTRNPELSFR